MSKTDQGILSIRYKLVPRVLVFLTSRDQILLLKGASSKKLWPDLYNGIGGHVEQAEDIFTAARRELFEESGIAIDRLELVCISTIDVDEDCGVCVFIFHQELSDIASYPLTPSAEGPLTWVNFSLLPSLPMVADLTVMIPHLRSRNWAPAPSFAHYSYDSGQLTITFADSGPTCLV